MVRSINAIGAAAATVGMTVTRMLNYEEKNGIPPLNVLYTSDEDQAWYFMKNRLDSKHLGIDMQWKPVVRGATASRSSLLQIAAGDWVLIFDVLPTPWYGTPALPLSDRMCKFIEKEGRTFYGMILPVDAARIAFELNCAITKGVDLRKTPWPGANTTGGMVNLGNRVLNTTVSEDRKVAISNWEWRPLTRTQLRYLGERSYISWAIADHFLKTEGRPDKNASLTDAQVYGAGARLRKAGIALTKTRKNWSKAKAQWQREEKRRKEAAEAAELAAAEAAGDVESGSKVSKRKKRASKVAPDGDQQSTGKEEKSVERRTRKKKSKHVEPDAATLAAERALEEQAMRALAAEAQGITETTKKKRLAKRNKKQQTLKESQGASTPSEAGGSTAKQQPKRRSKQLNAEQLNSAARRLKEATTGGRKKAAAPAAMSTDQEGAAERPSKASRRTRRRKAAASKVKES